MSEPRKFWTTRDLVSAAGEIARWLKWEREELELFHEYARQFGGSPGGNVFRFVLEDALRQRGLTVQQFKQIRGVQ